MTIHPNMKIHLGQIFIFLTIDRFTFCFSKMIWYRYYNFDMKVQIQMKLSEKIDVCLKSTSEEN